jgi:farnesyl diphosphate synthase
MDNDDVRRGRPTTHRRFDVSTATRAGFLLVPVAARVLAKAVTELGLPSSTLGRLAIELFEAGGIQGMVGGQWLDLEAEHRRLGLDDLIRMHAGKTGALIRAACTMGGIAGAGSDENVAALTAYGEEVGLAFQIADDVLDATGTSEALGKTAGRDAELAKSTYVSLLGVDAARRAAARHGRSAVVHLEAVGLRTPELAGLADFIVTRGH